ncbi:hypothetical protein [Nostoc sp. UHCC 0870]|uniref:hypothetical protein n=1 Tax=Nostoc sp. UHCC 0870 TaxID=2914041 RepID=UPI001EDEE01E|nr:hypothetical protein [Nostoc sp. UHCC 0870]UKO99463.1 hypothetical protein L6494_07060 [Nostoc sp. UHCC 0870]
MTISVADKNPISATVWRRHQDPPGLWIAVAIGSVSLHLLAFWLMRSPNGFRPWFPQQSQAVVPIELVEISPQESTTKPPTPQAPKTTPETAPPTSTNQDDRGLDFGGSIQQENSSNAPQPDTQVFAEEKSPQPEPTSTPTPTPQPEPTSTPTPEPTQQNPTVPLGERPWERRQDIELGKGTPLPSDNPNVTPEQIAESGDVEDQTPRTLDEETANTSSQDPSTTPNEETPSNSSDNSSNSAGEPANNSNVDTASNSSQDSSSNAETTNTPAAENSPNQTASGSIATLVPLGENEVRQLIEQRIIGDNDLPDVLSIYQGSNSKTLESSYLPSDTALQPAKLLASLVVDQNGKFQQAVVLEIEPAGLAGNKSLYEQVVTDLFRNENFIPGQNRDGTKPEVSNSFIWVTIEPVKNN